MKSGDESTPMEAPRAVIQQKTVQLIVMLNFILNQRSEGGGRWIDAF